MRWVLNHVATGLIGVIVVGGMVLAALGGLHFVRQRGLISDEDSKSLAGTLEVVGAIYGIVLAFVIVLMWQGQDTARDAVSDEASALAQFSIDIRVLPPADRDRIEQGLSDYLHAVVNDDWRLMREGNESLRAHRALDDLLVTMEQVVPETEVQKTWYGEAISKVNEAASHRRKRLEAMSNELPNPLRFLLFGGGLITLAFVVIHGARRSPTHTFVVAALSALVAYNLYLVVVLDYPFSGSVSVSSEPFRQGVLARFAG
jgi:hypothetical protein